MNNVRNVRLFVPSKPLRRRMLGVVLPIVLVILTVLTGLVVTQIRRGAVDERLGANARETMILDDGAQTVLRWCEARIISAPRETVTVLAPTGTTPAWKTAANWNDVNSLNFSGVTNLAGINANPSCIIEDATCELAPPISPSGQNFGGCNGIDDRWRKYRITARVFTPAADFGGNRAMFAQSEVRVYID